MPKTIETLWYLILDLPLVDVPFSLPTAHLLLYPIKTAAQTHKPLIVIGQVIYRCSLMDSCLGLLEFPFNFVPMKNYAEESGVTGS